VVEAVVVKDKQGSFIHGLTAKDFVLTEDGVAQTARYCEHQELADPRQSRCLLPRRVAEEITIYKRLARTQIAPETMDNERYKNRRLLAFTLTCRPWAPPTRSAPCPPRSSLSARR
jgi:hypothetical protein